MMIFFIELGDSRMAAKRKDWQAQVKGLLKAELARRNLSYADLAEKLAAIGVKDNERNISNKIGARELHRHFFRAVHGSYRLQNNPP